jgi:stage V sporulation protein S
MNRFFSKLDLRDIKISPEGNRFPPDADDQEVETPETGNEDIGQDVDRSAQHDEVKADDQASSVHANGHHAQTEYFSYQASETLFQSDGEVTSVTTSLAASFVVDGLTLGEDGNVLKVSARSRPSAVAGAIAGVVREAGRAEVQAIGAGATNQAVKAVAIAREYLRETGIDAVCVPAFIDVTIENEDRTAIRLVIEPR